MIPPDLSYSIRDDVRFRIVDGQAVVVRQTEGEVLVLNEVATRILQLLGRESRLPAILATLREEYEIAPARLERETLEFLRELQELGVIRSTGASSDQATSDVVS